MFKNPSLVTMQNWQSYQEFGPRASPSLSFSHPIPLVRWTPLRYK